MPTSTTNPNPINRSQKESFTCVLKDRDGVVDAMTPITWVTADATLIDIQPDPADTSGLGRNMMLIGKGPSLAGVNVTGTAAIPTAQGGPMIVIVAVTNVADTPNVGVIECTFGPAVPKT